MSKHQNSQTAKPANPSSSAPGPSPHASPASRPKVASTETESDITAFCLRLGHEFTNADLLDGALTHPSVSSSVRSDYQRLEFLGDRVLGLVMAEELFAVNPDANEGELAVRFNSLVRKETCANVARQLELGNVLQLGRAEMLSGGRSKDTVLGDAMEAVIAAVFLDAGYFAARDVILTAWGDRIAQTLQHAKDPKSALQEWTQSQGHGPPEYTLISRDGPDHAPEFTIQARLGSGETATATAGSKKTAEQDTARVLLLRVMASQPAQS